MKTVKALSIREWILGFILYLYFGGFSYFWAASTNDLYVVVAVAFLTTQLIANRIFLSAVLQRAYDYRIKRKIFRILINFIVNVMIGNLLMLGLGLVYSGRIDEFLAGPVVYGVLFSILYMTYMIFSIQESREEIG